MSITTMRNAVTSKMGIGLLKTQKHSPAIMFGAGVVGVVATVVLASRATLKADKVVAEFKSNRASVEAARELRPDVYSESEYQKEIVVTYAKAVTQFAKLYGPSILLGVCSIGLLTGAHVTLTRRNASLTAAYVAVEKAFNEYSKRVREELGEDKERELRHGFEEREVYSETKEGEPVVERIKAPKGNSKYAVFFDEFNPNWNPTGEYNIFFLKAKQNYLNDLLQSRGWVTLNDVHDALGLDRTKVGMVVGWVKGHGDDYIDFGIWADKDMERFHDFMVGREKAILLDFNVDGLIYDKI